MNKAMKPFIIFETDYLFNKNRRLEYILRILGKKKPTNEMVGSNALVRRSVIAVDASQGIGSHHE